MAVPAVSSIIAVGVWASLLAGICLAGWLPVVADPGDFLIRNTIRLSLAYYAVAVGFMLYLRPSEWNGTGRGRLTRLCWSLAWLTYLVHLAMAFHYYHHWSHADAVQHTEEVSGFGPGIWFSHLFTLMWTCDVAAWWLASDWYAQRSAWFGRVLHAYMAFIVFNGTVVYETGLIRAAGITAFSLLAILWVHSAMRATPSHHHNSAFQEI